jgi:hypothetical protein
MSRGSIKPPAGAKPYNHFMVAMTQAMSPDRAKTPGSNYQSPASYARPQTAFNTKKSFNATDGGIGDYDFRPARP